MKTKVKRKRTRRRRSWESTPVTMLESELHALHRDLRTTAKAYVARLENDLLVCLAALRSYGPIEQVSREMLFFFSSRRRHTRLTCDWSSDVCSSDLRRCGCHPRHPPVQRERRHARHRRQAA